jgi:hypothetical protein
MLTMATEETRHYVQTLKRLKTQYTSWAARIRATERYADRSGHTSNDAIGNALWMWAKDQDPEEMARKLEPYLDQFQQMWIEKDKVSASGEIEQSTGRDPIVGHSAEKPSRKKGTA